MFNYLIALRFVGTRYHGSQIQKNAVTIQSVFQQAFFEIFRSRPDFKLCSRTDSGVHANRFYLNFHMDIELKPDRVTAALNGHLPSDIRVLFCESVLNSFHARYSAVQKRYVYLIDNGSVANPFLIDRSAHLPFPIDEVLLHRTAQAFVGEHDFSAFCGKKGQKENRVRTVSEYEVSRCGDRVMLSVVADGFLYNMARAMAGTLMNAARGKVSKEAIAGWLLSGERHNLIATAPAYGLYLDEVYYKERFGSLA